MIVEKKFEYKITLNEYEVMALLHGMEIARAEEYKKVSVDNKLIRTIDHFLKELKP